jgi:hypothetical protein
MKGIDTKGVAKYLVVHPGAIRAVMVAGWRLRTDTWWRTAPFLPIPSDDYWTFRMKTATGSDEGPMSVLDTVHAAQWTARQRVER